MEDEDEGNTGFARQDDLFGWVGSVRPAGNMFDADIWDKAMEPFSRGEEEE